MSAYAIACIEHQLLRKPGFYQRPPPRDITDLADNDVMTLIGKAVVKAREEHTLAYWEELISRALDDSIRRGDPAAIHYVNNRCVRYLLLGTQGFLARRWAEGPRPGDHRRHGRNPEDYFIKPKQMTRKYYKKFVENHAGMGGWRPGREGWGVNW